MKRFILICGMLFSTLLGAQSYFDVGGGTFPLNPKKKSTYIAVGQRYNIFYGEVDLSASHQVTSSFQNYLGAKALFSTKVGNQLTIGVGPGVGSFIGRSPKWGTAQVATVEGILAYELPHKTRHVTPSVQVGITKPLHVFHNGTGKPLDTAPSATFSLKLKY